MAAGFDLTKTKDDQFMFNLRAANGEIILTSESYKAKVSALNGIESVRKNASTDSLYDRLASGDYFYFHLKAANHEIIGRSQRYTSAAGRDNGIESVKKNAPAAPLHDVEHSAGA